MYNRKKQSDIFLLSVSDKCCFITSCSYPFFHVNNSNKSGGEEINNFATAFLC